MFKNAAVVLGKSSMLDFPRVSLKGGGTVVSYLNDSIGLVAGEAASLLNQLTFDGRYVLQQRKLRSDKQICGISDGMVEASKSLVKGIEGLFDIGKKPIQGAIFHGFGGFVGGVGFGLAGSVVKPISKLGEAISDVSLGISALVTPDSASVKRHCNQVRRRQPRLLFSEGVIRPWSELESELFSKFG